jgi:hypothetical protein
MGAAHRARHRHRRSGWSDWSAWSADGSPPASDWSKWSSDWTRWSSDWSSWTRLPAKVQSPLPATVTAVALRPVPVARTGLAVAALSAGAVAALTVVWPAALLLAIVALALDIPSGKAFGVHRAAALVAIQRRPARRGWRRYLPLERAGPDLVLNRPLNGALLAGLMASLALVLVAPSVMVGMLAVLFASYFCLGRPERAWVSRRALASIPQLAAPAVEAAPGLPADAGTRGAAPAVDESGAPLTAPAIRARIESIADRAGPLVPAGAAASLARIRDTARVALPTDDRALDFTDHETWLIRQIATDYLPSAIDRYLAVNPAARDRPVAAGRTADEVLVSSLDTIERYLREASVRADERDAAALLAYERFLEGRLARPTALHLDGRAPRVADETPTERV